MRAVRVLREVLRAEFLWAVWAIALLLAAGLLVGSCFRTPALHFPTSVSRNDRSLATHNSYVALAAGRIVWARWSSSQYYVSSEEATSAAAAERRYPWRLSRGRPGERVLRERIHLASGIRTPQPGKPLRSSSQAQAIVPAWATVLAFGLLTGGWVLFGRAIGNRSRVGFPVATGSPQLAQQPTR
jgi:hypothetical protein